MQEFLYSVEREYPVSIATLWNAWANGDELAQWYFPVELAGVENSFVSEPIVGGWWTVGVDVPEHGFQAFFYGKYSEVEKHNRLVHTMVYTQSAGEFAARDLAAASHEVVIEFEDRGTSSWVKFSQFGELPEGEAPKAQAGMESYFDNLGIYLSLT